MRRVATSLALLGLFLAAPACGAVPHRAGQDPASATSRAPSAAPAVTATNGLALAMLRKLAPGTNSVFSPLSVETALSMVDQGASGQTAAQLNALLGGVSSAATLAAANRLLAGDLHTAVTGYGAGGPTLDSADALWLQSGKSLENGFARTLSRDYGAPPQQTDFSGDPTGAIQAINAWVAAHTDGLIPSLMSPGQVTDMTELVLANAVYLNARWRTPFDPNLTAPGNFDAPSGTVSVPFMTSDERDPYAASSRYQAVALPYAHSSLQFLAVMPPSGKLDALQRWLSPSRLGTLVRALRSQNLDLSLPKFTLSFKSSLNGFLESEGVTRAFGPASQLDRIIPGQSLAIQAVEHAAMLTVAEKGTVAAAATGVSAEPTAVLLPSTRLTLNHPFLIFLRDTTTGAVLFAARVEDPASDG